MTEQELHNLINKNLTPQGPKDKITGIELREVEHAMAAEIGNLQNTAVVGLIYKDTVQSVSNLPITYPSPQKGWAAIVKDTGYIYQWDGTKWGNTGLKSFPEDVALKGGYEGSLLDIHKDTNKLYEKNKILSKILYSFIKDTPTLLDTKKIDPKKGELGLLNKDNAIYHDSTDYWKYIQNIEVDASGGNVVMFYFRGFRFTNALAANLTKYCSLLGIRDDGSKNIILKGREAPFNSLIEEEFEIDITEYKYISVCWSIGFQAINRSPILEIRKYDGENRVDTVKKYIDNSVKQTNLVLDYFINADHEFEEVNTSQENWEASIISYTTGNKQSNSNNKCLTISNRKNFNKLKYYGRKWQTGDKNDLSIFCTITGKKSDGSLVKLLDGVLSNTIQNKETYIINIEYCTEIYINSVKNYIEDQKITIYSGELSKDSVKNYIDNKLLGANISSSKIFNVRDYGAIGDGVIDDRIAIQNAINACFNAGGGKVYFPYPEAYYSLGYNLASPSEVINGTKYILPKSQLIIPCNDDTTTLITIELIGDYKINMADEGIGNVGRSLKGFIKSSRISSIDEGSSLIASAHPPSNLWGGKNYIHVHIENLVFRNETIYQDTHVINYMNCVNMERVTQFTFNYIKVETSSPLFYTAEPLGGAGIIMPAVGNKVQLGEGSAYIAGYYNGIILGEHFNATRLLIIGCVNAIQYPLTRSSYHSASITHFNCECCRYIVKMENSNQVLNIFNYDAEHHSEGTKWYNYEADVYKTGGSGKLNIFNVRIVRSMVGNVNEFNIKGTAEVKIMTGVGANIITK